MMKCPACGERMSAREHICPKCGHRLGNPSRAKIQNKPSPNVPSAVEEGRGYGLTLAVLMGFLVALALLVGLGVAGFYYGLKDRAQAERRAAVVHYQRGLAHLEQGEQELAIAEFEVALQLDPQNVEIAAKLAEARRQRTRPSPTPLATPGDGRPGLFEVLQSVHAQGAWAQVLEVANRLIALDPGYRRQEVDRMRFDAFYHSGLEAARQGRMTEAIRLFDQALALQPGDETVLRARQLATRYEAAMRFWGADWAQTVENLTALYGLDPTYNDVGQRLFEARVSYGDVLREKQDWCGAEAQYRAALALRAEAQVEAKQRAAAERCRLQPTGSGTPTLAGTPAPKGTFVGRVVEQTSLDADKIFIRGRVLNRNNKGVQGVRVQIKAWDWTAIAVTDGMGQYAFDGLANAVTYTLTLLDLPVVPVDAPGKFGKITWVNFEEAK